MNLKLLTLNAHSLHGNERERDKKMRGLCELLSAERPDIISLQEVNQLCDAPLMDTDHTEGYYRAAACVCPIPLKRGNFATDLAWNMAERGIPYHFTFLPMKRGYGRFDEGLAVFSKSPIRCACGFYISRAEDYDDHNTRMALLAEIKDRDIMICNLHTSRYDYGADPFDDQWKRLTSRLPKARRLFLMGDLNCPAEARGEGYDRACEGGFFDAYRVADQRVGGIETAEEGIDGWTDKKGGGRIDYIFSSFYPTADKIIYSRVLDGERGARVSDHFGVMVNYEGLEELS